MIRKREVLIIPGAAHATSPHARLDTAIEKVNSDDPHPLETRCLPMLMIMRCSWKATAAVDCDR